jgi:hypothetical protein
MSIFKLFVFSDRSITTMVVKRQLAESTKTSLTSKEQCCVLWATRGLAFDLIDDPVFRAQFGVGVPIGLNRSNFPQHMALLANKVQDAVVAKMKGECVTLGLDGWTNTRHRCFVFLFFLVL